MSYSGMQVRVLLLVAPLATAPWALAQASRASPNIQARVLDAVGQAIPNADVWVMSVDGKDEQGRGKTDGAGTFLFAKLPDAASCFVRACASGYALGEEYCPRRQPEAVVTLRLFDAGEILGRVLDGEGKPVAGAYVLASHVEQGMSGFGGAGASAVTDAAGEFRLERVPLGPVRVTAWREGYVATTQLVELHGDQRVEVTMAAGSGTQVSVTIVGLPADARDAVTVRLLEAFGSDLRWLPKALTSGHPGERGVWQARGLPDLDYRVVAFGNFDCRPRDIRLPAGRRRHQVIMTAQPWRMVPLEGRLLGPEGKPLANERLTLAHATPEMGCTTGPDGRFRFDRPAPTGIDAAVAMAPGSRWVLAAQGNRGASASLRGLHAFVTSEQPLELHAVRAASVRGRVLDSEGAPAAFARVLIEQHDGDETEIRVVRAARDGTFRIDDLRGIGDTCRLLAREPGQAVSDPFVLDEGADVAVGDLRLEPAATIEGTVRDARGPLPGAFVHLLARDGQKHLEYPQLATDRAGRFRFLDVPPGKYAVAARYGQGQSGRSGEAPALAASGASSRCEITIADK